MTGVPLDDPPEAVVGLLLDYQDGSLSAAAAERLAAWLREPGHVASARAWLDEQHLLARACCDRDAWLAGQAIVLARARRSGPRRRQLAAIDRAWRRPQRRLLVALRAGLAALLLAGVGLGLWWWSPSESDRADPLASWRVDERPAAPLVAGVPCRLASGETGRLSLADGSVIQVAGPAAFRLLAAPQHGLAIAAGGFDIAAAVQDPARPLQLHAALGRVSVLGTRFRVAAAADLLQVRVQEGQVAVAGGGGGRGGRWRLLAAEALRLDPQDSWQGSWLDGSAPWRLFHSDRITWQDDQAVVRLDPDPHSGWLGYGAWFPRPVAATEAVTLEADLLLPPNRPGTRVAVVFSCTDSIDAHDGSGQSEPDRFSRLQVIDHQLAFLHDPGDHARRTLEPLPVSTAVGRWIRLALTVDAGRMTARLDGAVVGSSRSRLPPGLRWIGLRVVADDQGEDAPPVQVGLRQVRLTW